MEREIIRGNTALAKRLGVSRTTVQEWRKNGLLDKAVIVQRGCIILYDLDRVFKCLQYKQRPSACISDLARNWPN